MNVREITEATMVLEGYGLNRLKSSSKYRHWAASGDGFNFIRRSMNDALDKAEERYYSLYDRLAACKEGLYFELQARDWTTYAGQPDISKEVDPESVSRSA